jgi:hypothetical protein
MKRYAVTGVFLLAAACVAGCFGNRQPPPLPEVQTREYQTDFNTAFAAVMTVLQNDAWQLGQVNRELGMIHAASMKSQKLTGPRDDLRKDIEKYTKRLRKEAKKAAKKNIPYPYWTRWEEITARVEQLQPGRVRVRLSLVRQGSLPSGAKAKKRYSKKSTPVTGQEQSVMAEEPEPYARLFEKLENEILQRMRATGR